MLSALAFYIWSHVQLIPAEVAHMTYSAGQTAAAYFYGFHSREITVDGCTTRYLEKGQGPTLVLLHGAGVSKETWLLMVPYLFQDYHLLIPDLPGHGQSCRDLERDFTVEGNSRWLKSYLDSLNIGRVHLAAHSVGASSVGWFIKENSERVESVTFIAPAGVEPVPAKISHLTLFMQELVQTGRNRLNIENASDFERVARMTVHNLPWALWGSYRFLAWEHMRNADQLDKVINGILKTRDDIQSGRKSLEELVTNVDMPAQVIWGEMDKIMHVAGADIIAGMRPDIKVHRLADVGHGPMVEAPQKTAELIETLVRSVESESYNNVSTY
ncbi:alpha/beta fold hydrolase [Parendozoicomonas sp. Alg238-R29]|uniref:alpha/beta fold hydrolase n=1 Tax=Parendozoicomonas sp. Alg238-R29 TaxID=2993446 RepID=UPI00248E70F7|nr:alpha/beta fold hydrolase [Parendozoicomonas sp. Alg238-R29]